MIIFGPKESRSISENGQTSKFCSSLFEITSFENFKPRLRTVANRYDDFVCDFGECTKNSVLRTFVITLLHHPVCQKPLRHSLKRMSRYYMRYHGWVDKWKVEMRPLSLYLYMNLIAFLSSESHFYYLSRSMRRWLVVSWFKLSFLQIYFQNSTRKKVSCWHIPFCKFQN